VILDLGARPNCDSEVRSGIWLEMAKVEILESLIGSGHLILGSESDSGNWNRSVM